VENYQLQASDDGATWSPIGSITNNMAYDLNSPSGWVNDAGPSAVTAMVSGAGRYLRIDGTVRCPSDALYGYSIWEVRVWGDADASCTP
jgi:hypothetical protein